ncbi:hypothetical protein K501DRAFT_201562 [Backusella circina FSU 941]|nr:hypothetical protein K501DRAFT_201562 [Backusella circina FSU 941]
MENASEYDEWFDAATALDQVEGNSSWINEEESDEYDWKLLKSKTEEIRKIRETKKNRLSMIFALRSSLTRNLGDMGNSELFTHSHVGSKQIISDYINEVIKQLDWIGEDEVEDQNLLPLDLNFKHEYFMTLRQSFGRTALLLSGGGTLGLHHFGIIKALINARLLPRIISGASCGSIMSAILCSRNEEERKKLMNGDWNLSLNVFESPDDPDTSIRRLTRLIKEGHLYDSSHLKNVLKEAIGDVTFQEAYNRSRLVLNITVSSSTTYEMPCLLNYLTAPDVVSLRKAHTQDDIYYILINLDKKKKGDMECSVSIKKCFIRCFI